jgi:hypothetical protein
MKVGVERLCRRFPGLEPEDAAQYLVEARVTLGEQATQEDLLAWAMEQAKADGYDDPIIVVQDREDDEGHKMTWEASLSDEGASAHAILASAGAADARRTRKGPRVSRRRLRQAIWRALAEGTPETQAVVWGRFGRLLYGLAPATFRELAREAQVALGTAWNLERRVRHQIQASLQEPAPEPAQLSWLPGPRAEPPMPAPPEPAGPAGDPQQLSLGLEAVPDTSNGGPLPQGRDPPFFF